MEDQNGLNLSLGLPCGRVTASQKGKTWNSSNDRTEEGERNNNVIGDVKNFLDGGPKLLDSVIGLQRSDLAKNEGSFFNDLSSTVHTDPTKRLNSGGFLVPNGGRYIEVEEVEEKTTDKNLYGESNNKRKRDRDSHGKTMTSHISINTDDDSTGDNEDVTDSEAESSDQVEINNEEVNGFKISSEKEVKFGNMSHGPPFSQSVNVINTPYSIPLKDSNDPIYSGTNALVNSNMPRMFGYSHVQLSSVDEGKFCAPASHLHSQHLHPTNARGSLNSDKHSADINITQVASSHPVVAIKSPSNGTHPHAAEEGSSKNVKGNNNISFRDPADTSSERPKAGDGLPPTTRLDFSLIKPGLAANVKFGGCGSYPNLPWVSTTGSGPNSKTISGVTYRYSPTQIKIVCACHGTHMSPEEFVRHATEEQTTTQDGGGGGVVSSFPNSNYAASTQS